MNIFKWIYFYIYYKVRDMRKNIKISDLNKAVKIDEDALLLVVQDGSNKTITIRELSEKINENTQYLLNKLYDEIKEHSSIGFLERLKNMIAKHDFQLIKQEDRLDKISHIIHELKHNSEMNHKAILHLNKRLEKLEKAKN